MKDLYNLKDRYICYLPFFRYNIKKHDGLALCCFHWTNDIETYNKYVEYDIDKFEYYWQSEKAKEFRSIIAKKDYSRCIKCPMFLNKDERFFTEKNCTDFFGDYGQKIVDAFHGKEFDEEYPYQFEVAYDLSCNLKCITCRDNVITSYDITEDIDDRIIEYAKHCHKFIIAGDGEALYSKHYLKILESDLSENSKLEHIVLMTNATLLKKVWDKIHPNTRALIKTIKTSVDATTKELFEKIRRNAKWEVMLENLEFLKELKAKYNIQLETTYTISKYNLNDFMNFPKFMEQYDFDLIIFNFADLNFRINEVLENDYVVDEKTKKEIHEIIESLKKESKIYII